MFRVCLVLVVAACAAKATPQPNTPANRSPTAIAWPESLDHTSTPATHREAALRMLDASGASAAMSAMMEISLEQQLSQNPNLRPYEQVLRDFLTKYLNYQAVREEMAKLYMDRFNELQLLQMHAFYSTTTGQLAVSEVPKLSQEGAQLGLRKVQEHMGELYEMMQKAMANQPPKQP